jgi:NADPH-dependent 2,4-dienoyl-CoA reductase/sulfur reductase-like enzyme
LEASNRIFASMTEERGSTARRGRGLDVILVETANHILPTMLDKNMAKTVERELEDNGGNDLT